MTFFGVFGQLGYTVKHQTGNNMVVIRNLMNQENYSPYCGSELCRPRTLFIYDNQPRANILSERWPRTRFNGHQFVCPECGWKSDFEKEFIDEFKKRWPNRDNCSHFYN